MANLLEQAGGRPQKEPRFAPLFMDRAFTGLFSQRAALHDPSDIATLKYYGGRPDSLWMGSNIELTNRLTLQRRPGLSPFSAAIYPTAPDRTFSFELINGTIQVVVDTGTTGNLSLTAVTLASGDTAFYSGTFPLGASNAYAGMLFQVTGFLTPSNNGTFVCVGSTTTTLILENSNAKPENDPATAISAGAVYVDNQDGTKTLLFGKAPGAGQTYFVAVAGILYMGDGVDTRKYTPGNPNGTIWNWGIVAPSAQPAVLPVPSGSAAVSWTPPAPYAPPVMWSTMGLIFDTVSQSVQQLISVNAPTRATPNTTQFGTSGAGGPNWASAQTPGAQVTEGSGTPITWTNKGPVGSRLPLSNYNNPDASGFGTIAQPAFVYDPATKAIYIQGNGSGDPQPFGTTSNAPTFHFNSATNAGQWDGTVKWFYVGNAPFAPPGQYPIWRPSTAYNSNSFVMEPTNVSSSGLPAPPTYLYVFRSSGGTSGTGGTPPPFQVNGTPAGQPTTDGDLVWSSLGTYNWASNTLYTPWISNGIPFSVVKDQNGNFQICVTPGGAVNHSGIIKPSTPYVITSVDNNVGGLTTVYHFTAGPGAPTVGNPFVVTGFSNPVNNGTFQVVSSTSNSVTLNNPAGVAQTQTVSGTFNPWAAGYGAQTVDGQVTWTCVGTATPWTANTTWFLPNFGFSPPSASSPYGGAAIKDSNGDIEFIINSGLGGLVEPTWNGIGFNTSDGGTPLTLTQVTVSGTAPNQIATYTGTITGGAGNALVGHTYLIAGFATAGNNVLIEVIASTSTTLVAKFTTQVNETHAGTATTGAIWFNLEVAPTQSLSWKVGYNYAYSYKSRTLTDFYSVNVSGTSQPPVPPGLSNPLPAPTGSETGAISTASPVFTIVGPNPGAINTVGGQYSADPAVDTIVIWRSADGGGPGQMFELTEIPNIPALAGSDKFTVTETNGTSVQVDWVFKDFLPDSPNGTFPGLNILIPAPIDDSNNPPASTFLPMVYNFGRIWGAQGQQVSFSGGPDVLSGNPNEAFAPADEIPFLSNVVRLVKNTQGLVTFLTNSIQIISGGPQTASFFSVELAPNIGLQSYNELDVHAGEIYFFSADNQFYAISPSLNLSRAGFPIGDQLANIPSSGVSDATWISSQGYVATHQNGIDNAIFVADGLTGWYRVNPYQTPGGSQGPEPIWSPFASISGGCKMVQSIETAPGIKKLLVGATTGGKPILYRDLNVFTDNGVEYDANFVIGSIVLVHPGQLAVLKFLEMDFSGHSFRPVVSFLLNEIAGTFTPFTSNPQFDPPSIYGTTGVPGSYSPSRYYFSSTKSLARARHMQIKVDFGKTSVGDELFNLTIMGRIMVEF